MKTPVVLVVDDEPGVLKLVGEVLRRAGYEVLPARSAEQAQAICEEHRGPIDGVLLDVMLPDTGGLELYPRLEALHPEMPVLFMGGYPGELVMGSKLAGAPFIAKPFQPSELVESVRRVIVHRP